MVAPGVQLGAFAGGEQVQLTDRLVGIGSHRLHEVVQAVGEYCGAGEVGGWFGAALKAEQ